MELIKTHVSPNMKVSHEFRIFRACIVSGTQFEHLNYETIPVFTESILLTYQRLKKILASMKQKDMPFFSKPRRRKQVRQENQLSSALVINYCPPRLPVGHCAKWTTLY